MLVWPTQSKVAALPGKIVGETISTRRRCEMSIANEGYTADAAKWEGG